jgi:hypothetical protein
MSPVAQTQTVLRRHGPQCGFQHESEVNSSIGSENPFNRCRPTDRLLCPSSVAANCDDINNGRPVVAHTV